MDLIDQWKGEAGDAYQERNALRREEIRRRNRMWAHILGFGPGRLMEEVTVLEIGAGTGNNVASLLEGGVRADRFWVVEPNLHARMKMAEMLPHGHILADLSDLRGDFDLVFTSGVMIHVNPDDLGNFVDQMHARVRKGGWLVAVEYFSKEPREVPYRGPGGVLWTRDFGKFIMERTGAEPIACGFEWEPMTGLDDLTFWVFRVG